MKVPSWWQWCFCFLRLRPFFPHVPQCGFEPCWKKDLNSVSWMLIFHLDSGSRKSLFDLLLSYWLQVSFKSIQVQPIPPFFHGGWWNSGDNSCLKEWSYGIQIWFTAVTETLMIQPSRGCTPCVRNVREALIGTIRKQTFQVVWQSSRKNSLLSRI